MPEPSSNTSRIDTGRIARGIVATLAVGAVAAVVLGSAAHHLPDDVCGQEADLRMPVAERWDQLLGLLQGETAQG